MATIRKRGDLQWQAVVKKKGFPTQRHTFCYKKEAVAWARDVESKMERNLWFDRTDAETTTFADALVRYAAEVTPAKKGADRELLRIKMLQQSSLAPLALAIIRSSDVAKYRDERLKTVGASTWQKDHALISHIFTIARKEWGMEYLRNPAKTVSKPKIRNQRDRRLQEGEEDRLLQGCRDYGPWWLAPMITLALATGMRRGELVSLRWDDVDLARKIATLQDTKNGDKRRVPLSPLALQTLGDMPKMIDGWVFPIRRSDSVGITYRRVTSKIEMQDLRFHDLRHEATSRFFEAGLDTMQVAAITGHKTLQMLKRYTHLRAEDLAELLSQTGG